MSNAVKPVSPCSNATSAAPLPHAPRWTTTVVRYTCMFIALFALIWGPMLLMGKEPIWSIDGVLQHYPFLAYEGKWLRSIVESILSGAPTLPLWDPAMGYGADVITTIGAYVGDPLNLLSVFFDERGCEVLLCVLVVVRLYLSGVAFIGYARSRGYDHRAVLLGSVAYAFSGWASVSFNHPFFIYPLIFFPLILWGADRIIEKNRPVLFIVSVAGIFMTYFYFGYMACVALIPYCLYRVRQHEGRWSVTAILRWALKYLLYLVIGMAIAGVVLAPIVHVMLSSDRIGLERRTPLLYPLWIYPALVGGIGGTVNLNKDTYWGICSACFLAVIALFSEKGEKPYKAAFVALFLGAVFPLFGKVMNGFAYYAERWIWIFTLYLCMLLVRMTPRLLAPNRTCRMGAYVLCGLLIPGSLVIYKFSNHFIAPALAVSNALVIAYALWAGHHAKGNGGDVRPARGTSLPLAALCLSSIVVANVGFWYFGWSGGTGRQLESLVQASGFESHFGNTATSVMKEIPDDGQWRYDISIGVPRTQNSDPANGLRSANLYSSIYNNDVDAFNTALGITSDILNHRILELRGRSSLESFLNMRYFMSPVGQEQWLPAGCGTTPILTKTIGDVEYGVYENTLALPTARVMGREALSSTDFLDLGIADRQDVILNTVVLDEKDAGSMPAAQVTTDVQELDYELTPLSDAIEVTDGGKTIVVREPGAQLSVKFPYVPNTEVNVEVMGLTYKGTIPEDETAPGIVAQIKRLSRALAGSASDEYSLEFRTADGVFDNIYGYTPDSHLYGGKHDWLVTLGQSNVGKTEANVTFTERGTYELDSLRVTAHTTAAEEQALLDAQESPVSLTVDTNAYTAEVDAVEDSLVLLTVPWSKGWTATVDGRPAELLKADIGFMAVDVPRGSHHVELRYETPWLRMGVCLSIAGVIALGAICAHQAVQGKQSEGSHFKSR